MVSVRVRKPRCPTHTFLVRKPIDYGQLEET